MIWDICLPQYHISSEVDQKTSLQQLTWGHLVINTADTVLIRQVI